MIATRTGNSKNYKSVLKYIEPNNNKPHDNNNGITKRNLFLMGVGCRTDTWQHTYKDFKSFEKQHPKTVKTYNFVLSSKKGDFDPHNKEDVFRFGKFATDVAKKSFIDKQGDKSGKGKEYHQMLIAVQADNHQGILHAHIIVNNVNIYNGKALSSKMRNIYRLRNINDKMVKQYNQKYPHAQIFDLNKHKNTPSPRQDRLITLLHNGLNDSAVKNMKNLRDYIKNQSNNMVTMHTKRPKKSKYEHKKTSNYKSRGRGVVFRVSNGDKNKTSFVKLSSLSKFYCHKYHRRYPMNYRSIKGILNAKRNGTFKPTQNTKASSAKSNPTPTPASSVTSSASIKPTNPSAIKSELSSFNNVFAHTHHHHIPLFTKSSTNAANANNFKSTNEPQMQYNYNQSSKSEDDDASSKSKKHISMNTKPVKLMKWEKVNNIPFNGPFAGYYYEQLLHHKYRGHWATFHVPHFSNPKLENLIINYERHSNDDDKQRLDDFESECDDETKQNIETRLTTDKAVNVAKQSERDFYKDKQELNQAKINQKRNGLSR